MEISQPPSTLERKFVGIGVSPGIVTGKIFVYGKNELPISHRMIKPEEVSLEISRLEKALMTTRQQLQEIQKRVAKDLGEVDAALFDAQLLEAKLLPLHGQNYA